MSPSTNDTAPVQLPHDLRQLAIAMTLLWTYQPRTSIYNLLRCLGCQRDDGRALTQQNVKEGLRDLREQRLCTEMPRRQGFYRLKDPIRARLYRELLDEPGVAVLREALYETLSYRSREHYYWMHYDAEATIAILRLEVFSGASQQNIATMCTGIGRSHELSRIIHEAVYSAFDPQSFERVSPELQWELIYGALVEFSGSWNQALLPVCDWAAEQLQFRAEQTPDYLRLAMAEIFILRGDCERCEMALEGVDRAGTEVLRACLLVQKGQWAQAQEHFEAGLAEAKKESGKRKNLFPATIAWCYPLCLLAQGTPRHIELARKFCRTESGRRNPAPAEHWGVWVYATGVWLGEGRREKGALLPGHYHARYLGIDHFWALLLAAWLDGEMSNADKEAMEERAKLLGSRLKSCRFDWLVAQVDAAWAVLQGRAPDSPFFVTRNTEPWRELLSALQALESHSTESVSPEQKTRVLWSILPGLQGRLEGIEALEQRHGKRGWTKPKPLSFAKIAKNTRLPPWDAKVARAIHRSRYNARIYYLDQAAAIVALIGHPAVVLSGNLDQTVDLVEGRPEIELQAEEDGHRLCVIPEPRTEELQDEDDGYEYYANAEERQCADALRRIYLLQESSRRLKVFRLSDAQRRAFRLIANGVRVPDAARDELQPTLRALAKHFQVQSDEGVESGQASRSIKTETRLRAELSLLGEHLQLRLVVAPLGRDGPRLQPGVGRSRLIAAINGETVATERDLAAERVHRDEVLEALPYLDSGADTGVADEWLLDDPEEALTAVEVLPELAAVAAIDWPKGDRVRVVTVDAPQVEVGVRTRHDWFHLSAKVQVDENRVLNLSELLSAAGQNSRFVPIGDGVYLALTRQLKQRLGDLAAVTQTDKTGARVPRLAADWLQETLEGTAAKPDQKFEEAIERLQGARAQSCPVPGALQANLRPYQEDGFQWAMRLAAAGLGGCLADDMGLGKTVQALAILVERAGRGAALVVAPTSVCGNWMAETQRFAPNLNTCNYADAERDVLLSGAGARDVVIVSYALLQNNIDAFAARQWNTVILDEAQAIKNAAARRTQAVFRIEADFRLALSGTPIENRLAELWSILRFASPGLLGTMSSFNQRFATPIERDGDRDARQRLRRLIAPFVLRRTKSQVLQELPDRSENLLHIVPNPEEAALYETLRRQAFDDADQAISEHGESQARFHVLAQLTRLRRAACDPRLVDPAVSGAGAKVRTVVELADELIANGHKALVFSLFVDFLKLLRDALDESEVAYHYLDGSTPARERDRRVSAFQSGEGDLFLISLKAGGFGLNLTAADYVVITDPWWNPAAEDQALGRAHRIGQQRPVTVYRLVTEGTVEERIVSLHHEKRALADSVLEGGDATALPSTTDLVALIRDPDSG